jgi:hypothetical protein
MGLFGARNAKTLLIGEMGEALGAEGSSRPWWST